MYILYMGLLCEYKQLKKDKKSLRYGESQTSCEVELYHHKEGVLVLQGKYVLAYANGAEPKKITFIHQIQINLNNGDIGTHYEIKNNSFNNIK